MAKTRPRFFIQLRDMENNRYLHKPKSGGYVTAVLYDGTKEKEEEIKKAFPDLVVRPPSRNKGPLEIAAPDDHLLVYPDMYILRVDVPFSQTFGTEPAGPFWDRYRTVPAEVFESDHEPVSPDQERASGEASVEGQEGEAYEDILQRSRDLLADHRATYPEYVPYTARPNSPSGPGSPIMLVTDERGYFQLVFEDTVIPMNRAIRFSVEETVDRVTEVTATFAVEMGRRNPDLDKSDKNV